MTLTLLVLLLAVYFVPVFVAYNRNHANTGAIFALNLLLGWTLLGWVCALVWSMSNPAAVQPIIQQNFPANAVREESELPTKTCPKCAEEVKSAAILCRFCGHEFTAAS